MSSFAKRRGYARIDRFIGSDCLALTATAHFCSHNQSVTARTCGSAPYGQRASIRHARFASLASFRLVRQQGAFTRRPVGTEAFELEREREPEPPAPLSTREPLGRALSPARLLQLQRMVGNRAIAAMIQRAPDFQAIAGEKKDTQVPAVNIADKYKSANNDILQKIANALSTAADVDKLMGELNAAVQKRIDSGLDADGALDAELVHWETIGGFDSKPVIVSKILTEAQFKDFGKIKRMFHDLGVSKAHGIETHRLQWYVLIRVMDASGLAKDAAQLYLEIQRTSGLWRDLFDRDLNYATGSSPETLMNFLRTNASTRYPALAKIYDVKVGRETMEDKAFLRQWWDTIGRNLATQKGGGALPVFPVLQSMDAIGGEVNAALLGLAQQKAAGELAKY
jgi:hypothetical protein